MEKDSKRIILRSKGIFGAIDHWPWKFKKGHLTSKWIIVGLEHQTPTEMTGRPKKSPNRPKNGKKTQKTTFLMNHE